MTEEHWKLLMEKGVLARYEREFRVEMDGHLMSTDDKKLIVRGHKEAANEVVKLLERSIDEQLLDKTSNKPTVRISEKTWKILCEHNALKGFGKGLRVDVTARQMPTGQWELILSGPKREVDKLSEWLQHAPRKHELEDAVSAWLVGQGPSGTRIDKKANVFIQFSPDKRSALLIGSPRGIDVAVAMINGVQRATRRAPQIVGKWLCVKAKGSNHARSLELEKNSNTMISMGTYMEGDRTKMLDLTVVAECGENLERVFAHLDGLHKECFEVEIATARWLTNKRKGAEDARAREFDDEFDSFLDFTSDPGIDVSDTIGVEIFGENADLVRAYKRTIEATVVEKVHVRPHQFEFWYGHDREDIRDRPHHRLEDSTDTKFLRNDKAGLLHIAGGPQGVSEAVESFNKTRHIRLFTSKVSMAMSNYIALIRHDYEKDGILQIHLAYDDYEACGFVEFRRLHRMNSEKDVDQALTDDNDLMRKLDLHEIVLEVPAWAQVMVKDRRKLQETTAISIGSSEDMIDGRVLVNIAGSRSTVKRGMEEVLGGITSHRRYKEGDISLRRIQKQSLDTAGFKKTRDAQPVDLSRCKEPFNWQRLTRERWFYVGEPSAGRRPKGPQ